MYDDILYPTDGSVAAGAAYDHARALAEAFDATLHVLYVVDTEYEDLGASDAVSRHDVRETAAKILGDIETRTARAGLDVETSIAEGIPHERILEHEESVDLIVMGTRGRSDVDRYLLGSVTEKVVQRADVPVVTVRDSA